MDDISNMVVIRDIAVVKKMAIVATTVEMGREAKVSSSVMEDTAETGVVCGGQEL